MRVGQTTNDLPTTAHADARTARELRRLIRIQRRSAALPHASDGSPPRVCVDGRLLDTRRTGVCHYTSTLMDTLRDGGSNPLRLDALGLGEVSTNGNWERLARWSGALRPHARRLTGALGGDDDRLVGRDIFREAQIHFNVYNRLMPVRCDGPAGIMHWTYPVPLHMVGWRNIYTIHDTIPISDSGLSPVKAKRHARLIRKIARHADRLITVSESAREDIVAMLGCLPEFVVNSSQAVTVGSDLGAMPLGEMPDGIDARDYFLFCGSIEPRKNLERLVDAYKGSGSRRPLIICGPDGWRAAEVKRRIMHVPGVRLLPFQSRDKLIGLIRHARALLFPSLAEGFGLPAAEAMALGTPVMASSTGGLGEVTRGASVAVDPFDVGGMSHAIGQLCRDDSLCDRLSIAGLARSVEFSSTRYFQRLTDIYAEVALRPRLALTG